MGQPRRVPLLPSAVVRLMHHEWDCTSPTPTNFVYTRARTHSYASSRADCVKPDGPRRGGAKNTVRVKLSSLICLSTAPSSTPSRHTIHWHLPQSLWRCCTVEVGGDLTRVLAFIYLLAACLASSHSRNCCDTIHWRLPQRLWRWNTILRTGGMLCALCQFFRFFVSSMLHPWGEY
jgi:hypothetical protein